MIHTSQVGKKCGNVGFNIDHQWANSMKAPIHARCVCVDGRCVNLFVMMLQYCCSYPHNVEYPC
ncbi:hypothetical protein [Methanohalophilus portucalensis]|uniref:hypothetical protein n=1 Tax=Methanohalophilus portucalensis TaxID=39664 RepID=UPI00117F9F9C|nr:hypothetical protein [Methanohalophilus portucalensis]